MSTVLVTGATGTVGRHLVDRLVALDPEGVVRCATRNPRSPRARALAERHPQVELVPGDLSDLEGLRASVVGADGVYLLPPFAPATMTRWHEVMVDACVRAETVRFVVKHSVIGARVPEPGEEVSGIPAMHGAGERTLADSGLSHAVIRPTIFAQHFLTVPALYTPGADAFHMPLGDGRVAWLDARDIGDLAAHLLIHAGPGASEGRAFELTGSASVSGAEMAQALSRAVGHAVRYVDLSDEAFAEHLERHGGPAALGVVYRECREGWFAAVSSDLADALGRPARSFDDFARDHASALAGPPRQG